MRKEINTNALYLGIVGLVAGMLLLLFHAVNTDTNKSFGEVCHDMVYQTKDTVSVFTFSRKDFTKLTETYDIQYLGTIHTNNNNYDLLNSILSLSYGYPEEYPLISQVIFIRCRNKPVGSYQAKRLTPVSVKLSGNKLVFSSDTIHTAITFIDSLPRSFTVRIGIDDEISYSLTKPSKNYPVR